MEKLDKNFLAILIEAEYPDTIAKKISKFKRSLRKKIRASKIAVNGEFVTSTDETEALTMLLIRHWNQKYNAKLTFDEIDNLTDQMLDYFENLEQYVESLKELSPQDRYKD